MPGQPVDRCRHVPLPVGPVEEVVALVLEQQVPVRYPCVGSALHHLLGLEDRHVGVVVPCTTRSGVRQPVDPGDRRQVRDSSRSATGSPYLATAAAAIRGSVARRTSRSWTSRRRRCPPRTFRVRGERRQGQVAAVRAAPRSRPRRFGDARLDQVLHAGGLTSWIAPYRPRAVVRVDEDAAEPGGPADVRREHRDAAVRPGTGTAGCTRALLRLGPAWNQITVGKVRQAVAGPGGTATR